MLVRPSGRSARAHCSHCPHLPTFVRIVHICLRLFPFCLHLSTACSHCLHVFTGVTWGPLVPVLRGTLVLLPQFFRGLGGAKNLRFLALAPMVVIISRKCVKSIRVNHHRSIHFRDDAIEMAIFRRFWCIISVHMSAHCPHMRTCVTMSTLCTCVHCKHLCTLVCICIQLFTCVCSVHVCSRCSHVYAVRVRIGCSWYMGAWSFAHEGLACIWSRRVPCAQVYMVHDVCACSPCRQCARALTACAVFALLSMSTVYAVCACALGVLMGIGCACSACGV